ncbi:nitroreductase family protein [Pelobacter seleniigenes]|uniref:nitroreductase family protein n=1 Tax=Pelobacter seleniigenes TaxID=407188 RepID=UPI0004A6D388|nr:nitroreductase family protein [Pelobacter seleniigenes]
MLQWLRQRRSIRKFLPRSVEQDKRDLLKEALLRAPSSRNLRPCSFVMVDDPEILSRLATAKPHGLNFLISSPLAIVIVADPLKSDVWIEDSALAAIIVQLAAEALGLKSCWGQLRLRQYSEDLSAEQYAGQVLGLPAHLRAPIIIGIGYPAEDKAGHAQVSLSDERMHLNQYRHD